MRRTDTYWFDAAMVATPSAARFVGGWTAAARERYYALLGLDLDGRPR